MKNLRAIMLGLSLLIVTGCSSAPPPSTPATWDGFNVQANHDKQISLEGYVRLPAAAMVSDTMLLELHEKEDGSGKSTDFSTYIGTSANQVEKPPENYTAESLKLRSNDGTLIGAKDKVRVSGKFVYSTSSSIFFAPIDIQKL